MRKTLTVGEAARELGMSAAALKYYDAELRPDRIGAIGIRVYKRDTIDRFAAERGKR